MKVFEFAKRMTDSVVCLRDAGYPIQAIMLTYAGIDQMAWLSVTDIKSNGNDFKAWVDTYMLPNCPLSCTSKELWEARNGLLHMGTAEAAAHQKQPGIRKLLYTFGGVQCTRNDSTDTIFIRAEDLIAGYLTGVIWFMEDLERDSGKLETALNKLEKMLISHVLSN